MSFNQYNQPTGLQNQGLQSQNFQTQGLQSQGLQNQGLQNQGLQNQGLQSQGLQNQGYQSQPIFNQQGFQTQQGLQTQQGFVSQGHLSQTGLQSTGNLVIRPLSANLTHNTELITRMSPYVKFILSNDCKCTIAAKKMHLNPTWNQELVFRYHNEATMRVELWNKELLSDDMIAHGTIDLSNILNTGAFVGDVPLYYKDNNAGVLNLQVNYFPDNSSYSPFSSQVQQVQLQPETAFLSTVQQPVVQQPVVTQQMPVQTILEPIVYHETQRVYEQPVYVQQRPVIHEKKIIIEKPIITEKTIIQSEIPILRERNELYENTYYQQVQPVYIKENPTVVRNDLSTNMENLTMEGEPIVTTETVYQRDAPEYRTEQTEVFQKEVVHDRAIIHEKDIIYRERPVYIEKPEIREMPYSQQQGSYVIQEPVIRREVKASDDYQIPSEALYHSERVVVNEVPVFVKERGEVFDKEIIVEKPVILQQPLIYSEKQEIREKPEYVERRGFKVQQVVVEQTQPVVYRRDSPTALGTEADQKQRGSEQSTFNRGTQSTNLTTGQNVTRASFDTA